MRRGERVCLRDVSWSVRRGERWAILGVSGSGKTTLVEALQGEVSLVSGSIRRCFRKRPGKAREPREDVEHVQFTGQQSMLAGGGGYHQARWHFGEDAGVATAAEILRQRGRAATKIVSALGMKALLRRRATELSNGERRKLSIAAALASSPAVLVLDRPATGLDEAARKDLHRLLGALANEEQCVVITAARQEEIVREVTHVLCLHRGRVLGAGPRGSVLRLDAVRKVLRPRSLARVAVGRSPRPGPPVIELRNVTVGYEKNLILRSVTWTVRRGERWALLGANGAGKTTLLSLVLADNPQAYANDVALFGRQRGSGDSIWEIKRRIGTVSPEAHLHHDAGATALEVVCSGLQDTAGLFRRATASAVRRSRSWLGRVGLARLKDRCFRDLAESEQRLVLLARAFVKEPELLVLDEPCQGLDARGQERFQALLGKLARRSTLTLLYVTHEAEDIPPSVTQGLLLQRGRVLSQGVLPGVLRIWQREGQP